MRVTSKQPPTIYGEPSPSDDLMLNRPFNCVLCGAMGATLSRFGGIRDKGR